MFFNFKLRLKLENASQKTNTKSETKSEFQLFQVMNTTTQTDSSHQKQIAL
jgi:hypothetical protein